MLEEAIESIREGRTDRALRLLNRTIAENPRFWQALQRRGEAHLARGNPAAAFADFDEAIRLAPDESHLLEWRSRAEARMREPGTQG